MKKLYITIISFIAVFLVLVPSRAFIIAPDSGSFITGSSTTFDIFFSKPVGATDYLDSVSIYILVTNGTVTSFTNSSDPNISTAAACAGGTNILTDNTICVDLSLTSGYFTDNQDFGSFTVEWGTVGTARIDKTDNTIYYDSGTMGEPQQFLDPGQIGDFIILAEPTSTPTGTPSITPTITRIPETGIADGGGAILIGLSVILFGGVLYNYSNKKFIENLDNDG